MSKTKIEWADRTWNPIIGCSKTSPGCDNCYAEKMACRLANIALRTGAESLRPYVSVTDCYVEETEYDPGTSWNGKTVFRPSELEKPMKWKKSQRIFVGSMGDLFHKFVDFQWVHKIWDMMKACPQHTFLILTKRPERMKEFVELIYAKERLGWAMGYWQHVYLGVTAENQEQADIRIPLLMQIPAAVRFVSVEPMLGPVDLSPWLPNFLDFSYTTLPARLDWVICGGESGSGARPMHPNWVRSLLDQCDSAHVPFFFKQWGEWAAWGYPDCNYLFNFDCDQINKKHKHTSINSTLFYRVGKKKAGRLLDGVTHDEYPNPNDE